MRRFGPALLLFLTLAACASRQVPPPGAAPLPPARSATTYEADLTGL